jgi:hypothetical protein
MHIATSRWEKHGPALFVSTPVPGSYVTKCRNEIVHMHEVDGSMHVVLTPQDAKLVIERGWGERMGLAGRLMLPSTYVIIYAPRDESELAVVKKVLGASLGFLLGEEGKSG